MFSGKAAFTMDDVLGSSPINRYNMKNKKSSNKLVITEITVHEKGLYHAIRRGNHLEIARKGEGFIEISNTKQEVLDVIGNSNPAVEIHSEFDYIAEFDSSENDTEELNDTSIGFDGSSGFIDAGIGNTNGGNPNSSGPIAKESGVAINNVEIYDNDLDVEELEDKIKQSLNNTDKIL